MEPARQKFHRLVAALEDLVAQEAATTADGDFEAVLDLQRRADPIVSALAVLGIAAADEMTRARMTSLLARRQATIDAMDTQIAITSEELQAVQATTGRVARIAPAYGRAQAIFGESSFRAAV